MNKTKWSEISKYKNPGLSDNFRANSLDSLANSSNPSESLSDDSHDSDSGTETKSKNSFAVKCEVYSQNPCGSIRSWTKSESSNSDCYDFVANEGNGAEKKQDVLSSRMETIPEEAEPKVSVKEILARFENLKDKDGKDCNNNNNHHSKNSTHSNVGGNSGNDNNNNTTTSVIKSIVSKANAAKADVIKAIKAKDNGPVSTSTNVKSTSKEVRFLNTLR